jgi:hypothetical protein
MVKAEKSRDIGFEKRYPASRDSLKILEDRGRKTIPRRKNPDHQRKKERESSPRMKKAEQRTAIGRIQKSQVSFFCIAYTPSS